MFEDAEKKVSTKVEVDGVFVFIGMEPNTAGFDNLLEKDEWGYVRVNKEMQTSIQNVYAVGDLAEKSIRQITVAVAEGTIAAINAAKNLS
jgi:thioredoxin reductase (NADPH)